MSIRLFAPTLRYFNLRYGGFTKKARTEWARAHHYKSGGKAAETARRASYAAAQKRFAAGIKPGTGVRGKKAVRVAGRVGPVRRTQKQRLASARNLVKARARRRGRGRRH